MPDDPTMFVEKKVLDQMEESRNFWRDVALHLMDCQGATLEYDGMLKSCSRRRRARLRRVCETCLDAINGKYTPKHKSDMGAVTERLSKLVSRVKENGSIINAPDGGKPGE